MPLKKAGKFQELKPGELRWKCNPAIFDFESTNELEPIEGIVGQEKALRALKLGVDIKAPGYNIYISGLSGTGKATTVQKMLESLSTTEPELHDYAYVNNFEDPDRPILLTFPAGKAREFRKDISSFISFLKERIPVLLESESYIQKKKKIIEHYQKIEKTIFSGFEKELRKEGFQLGEIQVGESTRPEIIPIIENQPVPIFQFGKLIQEGKLTEEQANVIASRYEKYREELVQVFKKGMKVSQELQEKVSELERGETEALIAGALSSLLEKYTDEKIRQYLNEVKNSVLENLQVFKGQKPENETTPEGYIIDYFREYEVNIILDNSNVKGCPVIVEISPNYTNLFGTIEKINDGRGGWYADFTKIKAGSLLKANGGYIVLRAIHLFEEPGVWRTLKRVLNYRKMEIQDAMSVFPLSPSILKPEPIEITAKVILIGNNYLYYLLSGYEDDFKKIFKVKADFNDEVENTGEIMVEYARVIKKLVKEENLLDFDKSAIAYLLELASRYAGNKGKLTTRFSFLSDIAREANYWATQKKSSVVTSADVKTAYEAGRERHSQYEEKINELILNDTILIETEGERIGSVNGLAVYGNDNYSFGKPVRISATTALGNGNIINVERESGLSGKSHDKGMLIISGYFRETFGQNFPLSFHANIVFEQSYGNIDGDSASAAEIAVLFSSLVKIPIKQSLAITGSVNQAGDIQAIGGVNEKIEGFFDVCRKRKLTGNQGVIIPRQNVRELMLRDDIVSAVRKKEFHIYAVNRIEEALELLTGVSAGKRNESGHFEKGTLYYEVEVKLRQMYEKAKNPFKEKDKQSAKQSKSVVTARKTAKQKAQKSKPVRRKTK